MEHEHGYGHERVDVYDVVVVGGGAAGLSGAVALGRARRQVLVVDDGHPRNAPADGVHNYLGADGLPPGQLLARGREEVQRYGGQVLSRRVDRLRRREVSLADPGGAFEVVLDGGDVVRARRLLVTTGLVDELPALPGLAERWGRDVLHCPYCHGWEVRDRAIGVLGGPSAVMQALLWQQWSNRVTLLRHDGAPLSVADAEKLDAVAIRVVEGRVAALEVVDDQLVGVRRADGGLEPLDALVVAPRFVAAGGLLDGLGLPVVPATMGEQVIGSRIEADATGRTAVPGVWVAGNVTDPRAQVISAAAAGLAAAGAMNMEMIEEHVSGAVAAARSGHRDEHTHVEEHAHVDEHGYDDAAQYWEDRYQGHARHWTGRPNQVLVDLVEGLTPGTALDLGCGEGGDAVWLATKGWQVTAVDVAATALRRVGELAEQAGVTERIDLVRCDLARDFPVGTYALVSSFFMHSPGDFPREQVLRSAAAAVAPGGLLLIVGHGEMPPHADAAAAGVVLPQPDEVLAALELAAGAWHVERCEAPKRMVTTPDGQTVEMADAVLAVRRTTG